MNMFLFTLFTLSTFLVISAPSFSQCDTTLAVERWSEPVLLPRAVNLYGRNMFPFLFDDGRTLFFCKGNSIYKSYLSDTGWTAAERLSDRINGRLVQSPCLTSDRRELYFTAYTDGYWIWDIWKSTWSDSLNDWSDPVRLDTTVNSRFLEWQVYISRDGKKMFFSANDMERQDSYGGYEVYVSDLDTITGQWKSKQNMGYNINYVNHCGVGATDDYGAVLTANDRKLYYAKYIGIPYNFELFVSYRNKDSSWSKGKRLNISCYADTGGYGKQRYTGYDYYPTLSPDGKTLYFSSSRNTYNVGELEKIYVSHMIVDENGDSVLTGINHIESSVNDIYVLDAYPSPSNTISMVRFHLPQHSFVKGDVFDVLGRHIKIIAGTEYEAGEHALSWDGTSEYGVRVRSGIYYVRIGIGESVFVKKIIFMK